MIEGFFSKMIKQMLRGMRIKSKEELAERIYLYFDEVNTEPVVFHWKYNLDDVEVSEETIVDTLPLKKSGKLANVILALNQSCLRTRIRV